jgi:phosphocarrier protein
MPMIEKDVQIINQLGLHARAAAKLVSTATRFGSKIEIEKEGRRVDAKSIMSVMMLAASCGSQIRIYVQGEDEINAAEAVIKLINNRFGEEQ